MFDISNEYTFSVRIEGERTKKVYEGSFTVKAVLTYEEQVQLGLLLDRYNGGSRTIPEATFNMNRALAEMDIRVVLDTKGNQRAPAWWRDSDGGRKLIDKNVVLEVFMKALDAEADFDKRIEEKSKAAEAEVEKQAKKKKNEKESAE